jgi:broad specificity phosphatase PhoE
VKQNVIVTSKSSSARICLAHRHRHATIAVVSHAEAIRSAVLWAAGRSLDDFHQFPIDTASVTGIENVANAAPPFRERAGTPTHGTLGILGRRGTLGTLGTLKACSLSVIRAPERHT